MSSPHSITLRYFDARARVQFLRYYFLLRGHEFVDHRVPLSADFKEWRALRDDQSVTGPFKRLPVLDLDGEQLAEALFIANVVHERFGDEARLSTQDNARHGMLLSSVYTDMMLPLRMLVWCDRMYPGVDLKAYLSSTCNRVRSYLAVLDQALTSWGWLADIGQRELTLADCMIWDELDVAQTILGILVPLDDFETLARFHAECPGRETFIGHIAAHPCQFTGRPGESEALEAIHDRLKTLKAEEAS